LYEPDVNPTYQEFARYYGPDFVIAMAEENVIVFTGMRRGVLPFTS
jgi:hypothetical protein